MGGRREDMSENKVNYTDDFNCHKTPRHSCLLTCEPRLEAAQEAALPAPQALSRPDADARPGRPAVPEGRRARPSPRPAARAPAASQSGPRAGDVTAPRPAPCVPERGGRPLAAPLAASGPMTGRRAAGSGLDVVLPAAGFIWLRVGLPPLAARSARGRPPSPAAPLPRRRASSPPLSTSAPASGSRAPRAGPRRPCPD